MPPDQIPQTAQTTAPEDAMTDDQYWASLDADESGGATGTTLADRVGGGLREGADDEPAPTSGPGWAPPPPPEKELSAAERIADAAAAEVETRAAAAVPKAGERTAAQTDEADLSRALELAREQLAQRTAAQRAADGRYGGAQEQIKRLEAELAAAHKAATSSSEPKGAPTAEQTAEAMESPEAWKRFKSEFSDWGESIEALIDARLSAVNGQSAQQPQMDVQAITRQVREEVEASMRAEQDRAEQVRLQAARNKELQTLDTAHPGWRDLRNTAQYIAWINEAPQELKTLAESPHANDAIKVMTRFKQELGVLPVTSKELNTQRELRQRRSAVPPRTSQGSPQQGGLSEDEMTDAQYWAHLDRLEKSQGHRVH